MAIVRVQHIDAFSNVPGKGNPAGVVLSGELHSEADMQLTAQKVGFNVTTFLFPSDVADFRLRFFTPGHEMNLCGHATMAAVHALIQAGMLKKTAFFVETNVGVLPLSTAGGRVRLNQAPPAFKPFHGSKTALAQSIGLSIADLDPLYPIVYGYTGVWTLLIPIKLLTSFSQMKPYTKDFPDILHERPNASLHPFCFETRDADALMHARHFSSPESGIVEDPVTGTASGVMGAYYKQFINRDLALPATLLIEQGHELDKDGRIYVYLEQIDAELSVSISGEAVHVGEILIDL